jgi:hypothetical protein
MIKPTIGRQVWYWMAGAIYGADQPEAATVCYVHSDRVVNLQILTHKGAACGATSVRLHQADDLTYAQGVKVEKPFCEWMPYQKGQAAKTEQVESLLRSGSGPKDGS